jgi:hypothetical protein
MNASALSALLDPIRLTVAGAVCGRARSAAEIAEHTGLDSSVVLQALGALRQAGLVVATEDRYVLPESALRALALAAREAPEPMDDSVGFGMTDDERVILSRFFSGRSLTRIPADHGKRMVVLQRLALEFDVGTRYPETDVNMVLRRFHPDVAALRRHLVDEGFLSRDHGEYWRTGGRVPPRVRSSG